MPMLTFCVKYYFPINPSFIHMIVLRYCIHDNSDCKKGQIKVFNISNWLLGFRFGASLYAPCAMHSALCTLLSALCPI